MPTPFITLAPCVMVAGFAVSMRFSFGQPVTSEVHNVDMGFDAPVRLCTKAGRCMYTRPPFSPSRISVPLLLTQPDGELPCQSGTPGFLALMSNTGELMYSDSSLARRSMRGEIMVKFNRPVTS